MTPTDEQRDAAQDWLREHYGKDADTALANLLAEREAAAFRRGEESAAAACIDQLTDTFRRGAEAMRNAAAEFVRGHDGYWAEQRVRALPIPEEPR